MLVASVALAGRPCLNVRCLSCVPQRVNSEGSGRVACLPATVMSREEVKGRERKGDERRVIVKEKGRERKSSVEDREQRREVEG